MLAVAEAECAVVFAELVGGQLRAQQLARAVGADLQEGILRRRESGRGVVVRFALHHAQDAFDRNEDEESLGLVP
jgi:hypothetical protein